MDFRPDSQAACRLPLYAQPEPPKPEDSAPTVDNAASSTSVKPTQSPGERPPPTVREDVAKGERGTKGKEGGEIAGATTAPLEAPEKESGIPVVAAPPEEAGALVKPLPPPAPAPRTPLPPEPAAALAALLKPLPVLEPPGGEGSGDGEAMLAVLSHWALAREEHAQRRLAWVSGPCAPRACQQLARSAEDPACGFTLLRHSLGGARGGPYADPVRTLRSLAFQLASAFGALLEEEFAALGPQDVSCLRGACQALPALLTKPLAKVRMPNSPQQEMSRGCQSPEERCGATDVSYSGGFDALYLSVDGTGHQGSVTILMHIL